MWFFGSSAAKKARKQAREWVDLAHKVDHYRRDILSSESLAELRATRETVEKTMKSDDAESIRESVEALEKVLRVTGGSFYPRNFWVENVEMIVVAAILAVGVRTFFLQPFKIPTNSMYPTYNGLTAKTYFGDEEPALPARIFNIARLGATHRSVEGDPGDELILPLTPLRQLEAKGVSKPNGYVPHNGELGNQNFALDETYVPGRRWFVFPGVQAQYRFRVGKKDAYVRVPIDFPMRDLIQDVLRNPEAKISLEEDPGGGWLVHTGLKATEAGNLLSFDVRTGDMLFVDRFTYHFRAPHAGDPFVFRTADVPLMDHSNPPSYYIKRIAGQPGDRLQIDPPMLLRNGKPADAAEAFERNAREEGEYRGYVRIRRGEFWTGESVLEIPEENYIALGDNSRNSEDSRFWGFVPEKAIVGKAFFIYYPFSHRWGLAE